jgi:flagellar biosynthesis/type III secretory pathway M-ring protein FliF/YscJ
MSTGLIIAIVVVVLIVIALVAFVLPRSRARSEERKLVQRRGEVADAHRGEAEQRLARAEYAENQAKRERAEADLHESRANLHDRGMADDELDVERERLAGRDPEVRDPDVPPQR